MKSLEEYVKRSVRLLESSCTLDGKLLAWDFVDNDLKITKMPIIALLDRINFNELDKLRLGLNSLIKVDEQSSSLLIATSVEGRSLFCNVVAFNRQIGLFSNRSDHDFALGNRSDFLCFNMEEFKTLYFKMTYSPSEEAMEALSNYCYLFIEDLYAAIYYLAMFHFLIILDFKESPSLLFSEESPSSYGTSLSKLLDLGANQIIKVYKNFIAGNDFSRLGLLFAKYGTQFLSFCKYFEANYNRYSNLNLHISSIVGPRSFESLFLSLVWVVIGNYDPIELYRPQFAKLIKEIYWLICPLDPLAWDQHPLYSFIWLFRSAKAFVPLDCDFEKLECVLIEVIIEELKSKRQSLRNSKENRDEYINHYRTIFLIAPMPKKEAFSCMKALKDF